MRRRQAARRPDAPRRSRRGGAGPASKRLTRARSATWMSRFGPPPEPERLRFPRESERPSNSAAGHRPLRHRELRVQGPPHLGTSSPALAVDFAPSLQGDRAQVYHRLCWLGWDRHCKAHESPLPRARARARDSWALTNLVRWSQEGSADGLLSGQQRRATRLLLSPARPATMAFELEGS